MTKKTAYGYLLLLLSTSIVFTDAAFAQISAKEIARTRDDSLKTTYVCVSEADAKSFTSLRVEKPNEFRWGKSQRKALRNEDMGNKRGDCDLKSISWRDDRFLHAYCFQAEESRMIITTTIFGSTDTPDGLMEREVHNCSATSGP
jgi:hypothetical protein